MIIKKKLKGDLNMASYMHFNITNMCMPNLII